MRRVAAGEGAALLSVLERFGPRMHGVITTVVRDPNEAEEVLHRVIIELWRRHAERYDPRLGSVEAWLLRLARSRAVDRVRELGRRRVVDAALLDAVAVGPGPGDLRDDDAAAEVVRGLAGLPENEREAIRLAVFGGCSREAIAAHRGVPVGTVKTWIRRGILRLRSALSGGSEPS